MIIWMYWLIIFQDHPGVQGHTKTSGNLGALWNGNGKSLQWQRFFPLLIGSPILPSWRTCVAKSQIIGCINYNENLYSPFETMETSDSLMLNWIYIHNTGLQWWLQISTKGTFQGQLESVSLQHLGDAPLDNQSHYDTSENILGLELVHRWTLIADVVHKNSLTVLSDGKLSLWQMIMSKDIRSFWIVMNIRDERIDRNIWRFIRWDSLAVRVLFSGQSEVCQ